eukprot:jgi/Ulvmu1/5430/UM022_0225.1
MRPRCFGSMKHDSAQKRLFSGTQAKHDGRQARVVVPDVAVGMPSTTRSTVREQTGMAPEPPPNNTAFAECAAAERVPCPFDPTHDCKAHEVALHLRKCPSRKQARKKAQQPYVQLGINLSSHVNGPSSCHTRLTPLNTTEERSAYASQIGEEGLAELINKMRKVAELVSVDQPLRSSTFCPDYCKAHMDPTAEHEANIPMNLKHATQHASIIGNLQQLGLMDEPEKTTFVDLAAGKGFMSLMLVRATAACHVVLNDSGSFRLKADRVLRRMAKENTKQVHFLRCRVDLKDFSIGGARAALGDASGTRPGAETGQPTVCAPQDVVGIGKHLCGVATDWALRSLFNQRGFKLKGFCLAPCCHQRCQWDEYVGKDELIKLGLCQREVELLFWMGRWAFCGHEAVELPDNEQHKGLLSSEASQHQVGTRPCLEGSVVSRRDKVEAGRLSKVLLDYGRLAWIRSQKCRLLSSDLVSYVDTSTSGENRLLVVSLK